MAVRKNISGDNSLDRQIAIVRRKRSKFFLYDVTGPTVIVLLALMMLLGSFSPAWAEYSYKKQITIHSSQVSGSSAHSQYPLLINIAGDSDLSAHVTNPNGYDIIFKDEGGTQLAHVFSVRAFETQSRILLMDTPVLT